MPKRGGLTKFIARLAGIAQAKNQPVRAGYFRVRCDGCSRVFRGASLSDRFCRVCDFVEQMREEHES